jgi:hypothetical protein
MPPGEFQRQCLEFLRPNGSRVAQIASEYDVIKPPEQVPQHCAKILFLSRGEDQQPLPDGKTLVETPRPPAEPTASPRGSRKIKFPISYFLSVSVQSVSSVFRCRSATRTLWHGLCKGYHRHACRSRIERRESRTGGSGKDPPGPCINKRGRRMTLRRAAFRIGRPVMCRIATRAARACRARPMARGAGGVAGLIRAGTCACFYPISRSAAGNIARAHGRRTTGREISRQVVTFKCFLNNALYTLLGPRGRGRRLLAHSMHLFLP